MAIGDQIPTLRSYGMGNLGGGDGLMVIVDQIPPLRPYGIGN